MSTDCVSGAKTKGQPGSVAVRQTDGNGGDVRLVLAVAVAAGMMSACGGCTSTTARVVAGGRGPATAPSVNATASVTHGEQDSSPKSAGTCRFASLRIS